MTVNDSDSSAPVTVVIPTFNRCQYLASSIDSVLKQTWRPSQVMVINDGSTDDTHLVLEDYRDRVTVLSKDNGGKPSAINHALPMVEQPYLWVFDDDDVACNDAIERHLEVFERYPDTSFTYSGSYYCVDGQGVNTAILQVLDVRPVRIFPDDEYFIELLMSSYVGSPGVIVRTEIQRKAGEYSSDLYRSQDYEMGIRWSLLGPARRLENPRPTFYRRYHQGLRGPIGGEFDYSRNTKIGRNAEKVILRRMDSQIGLKHYLPRTYWSTDLDEGMYINALVRRIAVRLRRGLWKEAKDDMHKLAQCGRLTAVLEERSRDYIISAMSDLPTLEDAAYSPEIAPPVFEYRRDETTVQVATYVLTGIYWCCYRCVRARDWRDIYVATKAVWRLFRLRGLLKIGWHMLGRCRHG